METRYLHMGYSFRLAARVILYASSHRQNNTFHRLCYPCLATQAETRNSSMAQPWRIDLMTHRTICERNGSCLIYHIFETLNLSHFTIISNGLLIKEQTIQNPLNDTAYQFWPDFDTDGPENHIGWRVNAGHTIFILGIPLHLYTINVIIILILIAYLQRFVTDENYSKF